MLPLTKMSLSSKKWGVYYFQIRYKHCQMKSCWWNGTFWWDSVCRKEFSQRGVTAFSSSRRPGLPMPLKWRFFSPSASCRGKNHVCKFCAKNLHLTHLYFFDIIQNSVVTFSYPRSRALCYSQRIHLRSWLELCFLALIMPWLKLEPFVSHFRMPRSFEMSGRNTKPITGNIEAKEYSRVCYLVQTCPGISEVMAYFVSYALFNVFEVRVLRELEIICFFDLDKPCFAVGAGILTLIICVGLDFFVIHRITRMILCDTRVVTARRF